MGGMPMGAAAAFSPMKAVETAAGATLAVGTFSVRPSPKSAKSSAAKSSAPKSAKSATSTKSMRRSSVGSVQSAKSWNAEAEYEVLEAMLTDEEVEEKEEAPTDEQEEAAATFASPKPAEGRVNMHTRFGANGTPYHDVAGRDGGVWVASVEYSSDGASANMTLIAKCAEAGEAEGAYTEEEWAEWEAAKWAAWEEASGKAWEAENECYPWQFEEADVEAWEEEEEAASAATGTPQPRGGRVNSHIRFEDEEDEEDEEDYEEEYEDDGGVRWMEHGEFNSSFEFSEYDDDDEDDDDDDDEDDLMEVFGVVGVLSACKGPAPTPVGTVNSKVAIAPTPAEVASALAAPTPHLSTALRNLNVGSRAVSTVPSVATTSLSSDCASGLHSIARSYAEADDEEEDADDDVVPPRPGSVMISSRGSVQIQGGEAEEAEDDDDEEDEDEEDDEDEVSGGLPVMRLFPTPAVNKPGAATPLPDALSAAVALSLIHI